MYIHFSVIALKCTLWIKYTLPYNSSFFSYSLCIWNAVLCGLLFMYISFMYISLEEIWKSTMASDGWRKLGSDENDKIIKGAAPMKSVIIKKLWCGEFACNIDGGIHF